MTKIEVLISKLSKLSALELTENEINHLNQNPNCKEFLNVLDFCKIYNQNNLEISQKINTENNFNDSNKNQTINYPQFFICCGTQFCSTELKEFKECQIKNKNKLEECFPKLKSIENCLNDRIEYFYEELFKIENL